MAENNKTIVFTHKGEAKLVLQDIKTYNETQESLSLLKILALSSNNLKNKNYKPLSKTFNDIRKKLRILSPV